MKKSQQPQKLVASGEGGSCQLVADGFQAPMRGLLRYVTARGRCRLLGCYHPSQQNTFTGLLTSKDGGTLYANPLFDFHLPRPGQGAFSPDRGALIARTDGLWRRTGLAAT